MAPWLLPLAVGLLPFLALGLVAGTYAARRLTLLNSRCRIEFAKLERELRQRHRDIEKLTAAAESRFDFNNDAIDEINAARRQSEVVLARSLAEDTSTEALRALGSTERSLQSSLEEFEQTLAAYPSLEESNNVTNLCNALRISTQRTQCCCMNYNDAVMIFNAFRDCLPGRIFSSMLGYSKNARSFNCQSSGRGPRLTRSLAKSNVIACN